VSARCLADGSRSSGWKPCPGPPRSRTRSRSRASERDYGGVEGAGIGGDDEVPVGEPCSSWSACCRSPTIFWMCCW
jgi:hypothetical protein